MAKGLLLLLLLLLLVLGVSASLGMELDRSRVRVRRYVSAFMPQEDLEAIACFCGGVNADTDPWFDARQHTAAAAPAMAAGLRIARLRRRRTLTCMMVA